MSICPSRNAQCAKHRGGFIGITISTGVIINHSKSEINRVISDKIDIPSILFTSQNILTLLIFYTMRESPTPLLK